MASNEQVYRISYNRRLVRACRHFNCELSEVENYQLITIAKKLGLEHIAHDALSDSVVTAQTQIYLSKAIPELKTTIYFYTIAALTEAVSKNQVSPANIAAYCNDLLKNAVQINYDDYKELFKLIEQVAAFNDNASLYKYCVECFTKNLTNFHAHYRFFHATSDTFGFSAYHPKRQQFLAEEVATPCMWRAILASAYRLAPCPHLFLPAPISRQVQKYSSRQ